MKNALQQHLHIALVLVSLALVLVCGSWYVHHNQREVDTQLRTLLHNERMYLLELANITDSNDADSIVKDIIRDCPRRTEYEELLARLDSLTMRELISVQTLSESCGMFYAERKALMVAKLEREFTHYTSLLDTLVLLNPNDIDSFNRADWSTLIELEKARSTGLSDQARIQEEIISALITGESSQSARVIELVQEARDISELLIVQNQRIDEIRTRLAP